MSAKNPVDRMAVLEQKIADLERRVSTLEGFEDGGGGQQVSASRPGARHKKRSLKEFINEVAPQNGRETTLTVAYFLENDGTVPFNVQDLERGFRAAKIPPPKNINDMVNKNIQQGLLMEAAERKDSRKAWELTATGEREIQERVGKG